MLNYNPLVRNVLISTLAIQPGDDVIVETWSHGLPLAGEFVYQLRMLGARPMLILEDEKSYWKCVESLLNDKLGKVGDHEWAAVEKAKGYVFIPGPDDLARVWKDPSKFRASTSYNEEWYERAQRYRLKAARIALGYASPLRARWYKLPLSAWQRMLIAASSIDFAQLGARAEKLMPFFRNGDVNISASNGTNLNLRLIGREVSADDCVVDSDDLDKGRNVANIPGGYVLACPDEEYAEGTVVFDKPTVYMGRWVRGVRLEFKQNRLVDYQARQGAEHFKASYEKASGDKNKIAAVEVGINPKARTGFLQDSLASGVVTVGIGANDDVGGANKSDFYFEGVITKATLTVDGKVIVQNGKLNV